MSIIDFQINQPGQSGVFPGIIYILTDDTIETVIETGYLNGLFQSNVSLSDAYMALVATKISPNSRSTQVGFFSIIKSGENWSLISTTSNNTVILPTTVNHIATYTNSTGTISQNATTAINNGNIQAGGNGIAGYLSVSPSSALGGNLRLSATNNIGNFTNIVTNAPTAQSTTFIVPDPQTSAAQVLLDTGPNNIISFQQFVGLENIILITSGTWTTTAFAEGNYAKVHTPAAETSVIAIDISPMIRSNINKGFRLDSVSVIFGIQNENMTSHLFNILQTQYANNTPVSVNIVTPGTFLPINQQTNPYLTNISIPGAIFTNLPNSKYVVEIETQNSASTNYAFYGLILNFSQTIA